MIDSGRRLLIFSHEYPPCLGGVGTIAFEVNRFFQLDSSWDVEVLTSPRSKIYKSSQLKCTKLPSVFWPISYFRLFKKSVTMADVIICNDPASIYNAGRYLDNKQLQKVICLVHGEEKYLDEKNTFASIITFGKFFRRALNGCAKVIWVSSYIRNMYSKNYAITVNMERSRVINPGVLDVSFDGSKSDRNNVIKFVTVSRIHKDKGFSHMLSVFNSLYSQGFSFQWDIIGDGPYAEELFRLVHGSNIRDKIRILGRIERHKLGYYFAGCDFYILLSELHESYGLSYLEAASFGVKPIGYDRCGVTEVFRYIQNGLLLKDYKNVDSNGYEILNFVNQSNDLKASTSRTVKDFLNEIKMVLDEIVKIDD
ncbi:glycosyltransferase family 4 protein [Agarivorans sp. QJM3NY_25]|uniref:glycosyltransferase family 4 protein n=1 Tax=Agarivorans sp. QJM3NY_25 TaxID=3421430 RepID=UPI003D7C9185